MTKFYVVRHGQSQGNEKRLFLGHTNLGLTELGRKQAKRTAEFLKDKGIDIIYSSDLLRAYDTAKALGDILGIEPIQTEELREVYAGLWEGKAMTELREKFPQYHIWLNDIGNAECDEGESMAELAVRAEKAFLRLAEENPGKTVMVATHAALIRSMCCVWKGIDIHDAQTIPWVSNGSVSSVSYNEGKWEIEYLGYDEHISDILSKIPVSN